MNKLFAVYLGGLAQGALLEMHDVAFVAGPDIESTLSQLRERWFGIQDSLHIDSWMELSNVDGYTITLTANLPSPDQPKLFFVNIGWYSENRFGENHSFYFLVCENQSQAKTRAKELAARSRDNLIHSDNVVEIDSFLEISEVSGLKVTLEKTDHAKPPSITNLYWPINK